MGKKDTVKRRVKKNGKRTRGKKGARRRVKDGEARGVGDKNKGKEKSNIWKD